jgi:hypothetical protein
VSALWSYVLTAVGVVGLLMAGRKNLWGWAVCIASQVLWATYAITTEQWGFLLAAGIYTLVYGKNFLAWRAEARKAVTE